MIIFKYIDDKDVFLNIYSKMLAKRLVTDSSASDEAELNMIGHFKHICAFESTSKLQQMLTDVKLSKEVSEAFKKVIIVKFLILKSELKREKKKK